MKLKVEKVLRENVYSVNFEVVEMSPEDNENIADYGNKILNTGGKLSKTVIESVAAQEPIVDTNGDAVLDGEGNATFTTINTPVERTINLLDLQDKFVYFPKEFPITRSFAKAQYGEKVEDIANAYADLIESRVKAIVDEYKAKPDNFSSEKEVIL